MAVSLVCLVWAIVYWPRSNCPLVVKIAILLVQAFQFHAVLVPAVLVLAGIEPVEIDTLLRVALVRPGIIATQVIMLILFVKYRRVPKGSLEDG